MPVRRSSSRRTTSSPGRANAHQTFAKRRRRLYIAVIDSASGNAVRQKRRQRIFVMTLLRGFILLFSCLAIDARAADCSGWAGVDAPRIYVSSADKIVLVRDLDGDGAPEIIVSGNHVDQLGAFSLLPNRGDGTFAAERLVASGFGEELQDVGDLNHDHVPDLLVSNYWSNGIVIYLSNGPLQFDHGTPY